MISSDSSRVVLRSMALPTTAPATAPNTPITADSRRPPTDAPAMPPTTPPVTAPAPLWLPSTNTGRTVSTVASTTLDMRWASLRLITSGLLVAQPASAAIKLAAAVRARGERRMENP